ALSRQSERLRGLSSPLILGNSTVGGQPLFALGNRSRPVSSLVARQELFAVTVEAAVQYGRPDFLNNSRHKAQVMDAVQPVCQQLLRPEEVVEVAEGEMGARIAVALFLYRPVNQREARAFDGQPSVPGRQSAVSRNAGR